MESDRFDHAARTLANHLPRRSAVALLSALAIDLGLGGAYLRPDEGAAKKKGKGKKGKKRRQDDKPCGKGQIRSEADGGCSDDDLIPPLCGPNEALCQNTCKPACQNGQVFDASCACVCPRGQELCDIGCIEACDLFSGKRREFVGCGCVCPPDKVECNGLCSKRCDPPYTRDPNNFCLCNCPAGQAECNGTCYPLCGGGQVRDGETCQCRACPRRGQGAASAEACCPPGEQPCGTGTAARCCVEGLVCTTGTYNGQPRASCCNVANPPPGNTIIPCDGICCQTTSGIVCCPGRSNPCRDPGVGC